MSSKIFLQALQSKLKGGNSRSIHLNALPGRLATRLDLKQLDLVENDLSAKFLNTLLTKPSFEFKITFDNLDLNDLSTDEQKRLGIISKRLNSVIIENEDYYKEHGTKTLGFGYPILIKRSLKDPTKIIKAPLFIWPLDAIKSRTKVNEWCLLRNKTVTAAGAVIDADIHSVGINEVLLSFIKGEDQITLPNLGAEALEDAVIDRSELLDACAQVLQALNSGNLSDQLSVLKKNFATPINMLPDANEIDAIANNHAYIYFGGVFGLFRAQKESIITDISKLLERFDDFKFDDLVVEKLTDTAFSAVSTDPAQQAIISTLGNETDQIIQGPPGTGKSQSLTALVTNALANGLKCLVVCEKKTALDVIKRNIERTHAPMASLVAVIDDVNEDREQIVDSVRDRQNALPNYQDVDRIKMQYLEIGDKLRAVTSSINAQHQALGKPIFRGKTWNQIVGRFLNLKKAIGFVPLKNNLNAADFSFLKDEEELNDILRCLDKADVLYHQSLAQQPVFSNISDSIFKGRTVGEARVILENFINNALTQTPKLEVYIQELLLTQSEWFNKTYGTYPKAIQDEFQPYLALFSGYITDPEPLPDFFKLEALIDDAYKQLRELLSSANELRVQYESALQGHYKEYGDDLKSELSSYFNFVDGQIALYGEGFMKNTSNARFKTNILSFFSDKHRQIKIGRAKVRSRIHGIQIAQAKKSYIEHQYNATAEVTDLSVYVGNIRELEKKVSAWIKGIPEDVTRYVTNIRGENCHADFPLVKDQIVSLLKQYDQLTGVLKTKFQLIPEDKLEDVNNLIASLPAVLECLGKNKKIFYSFRESYHQNREAYILLNKGFAAVETLNEIRVCIELYKPYQTLSSAINSCGDIVKAVEKISDHLSEFRSYHEWRSYYLTLENRHKTLIDTISGKLDKDWSNGFECWYLFWILSLHEPSNLPKGDNELRQYKNLKREFDGAQLNNVLAQWLQRQVGSVRVFKSKGQAINSLFNKKGAKGMRRNSLRTIIRSEFGLFTDFFPVVLLNPSVCSSIIPLEEGIFDLVIFDEASQLRLEDTYASLIRGKAKIISGDKHQMAPSSYFEGSGAMLDPIDGDEDSDDDVENNELATNRSQLNLADSESLLAFAVDKGFKESYLTVHYRSRHPYLIDFSNHAFYGKRLIPVPALNDYVPIEFLQVDGIYENQTNMAEALAVVSILRHKIKPLDDGNLPSVGVATFNIYQRNLILDEIGKARRESTEFDTLMNKLGDSFFVKNLENIQGDERDVIILSNTFGRKTNGTFLQNFGPIIQGKGHRMLNVIITRAKHKIFICNSFPAQNISQYAQLIQQKGNKGRAILYAYLNYAKAISDKNEDQRVGILNLLSQYCADQYYDQPDSGLGSESPFEDEVFSRLAHHIGAERIEQQYRVGGFRIDMVIHPKFGFGGKIAIECDGAKYHSSAEAYAWDIFRQEQLEKFGFTFYRIWSTKWWDSSDKELQNLLDFIYQHDSSQAAKAQLNLL